MHQLQESANPGGIVKETGATIKLSALGGAAQGAAVVFILDRVSKALMSTMTPESMPFSNALLTIVHHKNYGIVANLPLPMAITVVITGLVIVLVLGAAWSAVKEGRRSQASALGILLGGAVGNLYDRVYQGYVFDWMLLFGRSAINLADIAIVCGTIWYFMGKRISDQRELAGLN